MKDGYRNKMVTRSENKRPSTLICRKCGRTSIHNNFDSNKGVLIDLCGRCRREEDKSCRN